MVRGVGELTNVGKQLPREELRKVRHAGEESQMRGWKLIRTRSDSRRLLREKLLVNLGGKMEFKKKKKKYWLLRRPEDIDSN